MRGAYVSRRGQRLLVDEPPGLPDLNLSTELEEATGVDAPCDEHHYDDGAKGDQYRQHVFGAIRRSANPSLSSQ